MPSNMTPDPTVTAVSELKPCPFCGHKPAKQLGKVGHCQLHGDPFQAAVVLCKNHECHARPRVEGGDVYNGGERQAYEKAVEAWNRRSALADVGGSLTLPPEAVELMRYRMCMSYNDSYFGEPAGLVKRAVAELERRTGKQPRPAAEDVQTVACSRGDLSADDLDRLVDQLCTPRSRFPFPEPIYLSQVALLELAKRLRRPAAEAKCATCGGARMLRRVDFEGTPIDDSPCPDCRPAAEVNNYHDAYRGARDDLLDWKRRALEAEATSNRLAEALAKECNGPTFMGEPVSPAAHTAQVDRDLLAKVYAQSSHDGTITPALFDAISRRLAEQGSGAKDAKEGGT